MALPELVAHRGYTLHYPENTLVAIEAAIAASARYIEVDVQLSRDEVPVLFHDHTLERLCGHPESIYDHTAAELAAFPAMDFARFGYRFANEPIATLSALVALLTANREVTAFVELKKESIDHFGASVVLARVLAALRGARRQCVLISYDLDALRAARAQGWARIGAVIDHWRERKQLQLQELCPEFLFCDLDGLPRFGKLRCTPSRLAVFEVGDARTALALARRGVEFIETFAVGELARELAAAGQV